MSKQIKRFYEFGAFRIDTANRLLLNDGEPVPLKAKAIDTLLLLVEHNGEVVEKDELMREIWPDSFVEEGNLTQNIYVLRKALGEGRYIESIPRRGYRFAAEVKEWAEPAADLILIKEKTRTSLSYEEEIEQELPEAISQPKAGQTSIDVESRPAAPISFGVRSSRLQRQFLWPALAVIAGSVVIGSVVFWRRSSRPPFESVKLTRFTTTGNALRAAISPDGKYLAHVVDDAGQKSVWLRQVATGKDLQIVPPARIAFFYGLTFSHDGNYIYYVNQEMNHLGMLFQVPSLGGDSTKLMEDVDSPVTMSPDDKRVAFIRGSPGEMSITIANVDGTGETKLALTKSTDEVRLGPTWTVPPAWSPDGKTIAAPVGVTTGQERYQTIQTVSENGTRRALTSQRWETIGRME